MTIEIYSAHGGGRYWRTLLAEWRTAGHFVREITAFDDIAYRNKRGAFGFFWLRLRTYVVFPLYAWYRLSFTYPPRASVRLVVTSPFFLPFAAALCGNSKFRSPIIVLQNDIFPDALVYAGLTAADSFLTRILGGLNRYSLRRVEATIFLGEKLKRYSELTYGSTRRSEVIHVGADSRYVRSEPPKFSPLEPLRLLYSGTMGYMHDIQTFLAACTAGIPRGVQFTFHSSGVGYGELREAVKHLPAGQWACFNFADSLPDEAWAAALRDYPIGVVTLKVGAELVSMPSKTYSAMAAGQAILAICSKESDLAALVMKHRCGWVVEPGDANRLVALLEDLRLCPEKVFACRLNSYQAGQEFYDVRIISKQYIRLFTEILSLNAECLARAEGA